MTAQETDWHGWSVGRDSLHVGPLPHRKRVALYVLHGSVLRPLAYFRCEADAIDAMEMIDLLTSKGVEP